MNSPRILLVEDDIAIQEAFIALLSKAYQIYCFNSAESFLQSLNDFRFEPYIPTCIVLDFELPGMTGIELQKILNMQGLQIPVLFISGNAKQGDIIDAWHGGAVDFLLKPFAGQKLKKVLIELFQKFNNVKPSSTAMSSKQELNSIPISQREAEVLLLLGEGYRQYEIAEMLNVTLRTIKWHRSNIKDKLNLNTLAELGRFCDEYRLSIEMIANKHQNN